MTKCTRPNCKAHAMRDGSGLCHGHNPQSKKTGGAPTGNSNASEAHRLLQNLPPYYRQRILTALRLTHIQNNRNLAFKLISAQLQSPQKEEKSG